MDALSIKTYQPPKFWSSEVAKSNILVMLVTEEMSQAERFWSREVAL